MLKNSIQQLMQQQPLEPMLCYQALDEILQENTNPLQIGAFLVLMRAKQETTTELITMLDFFRQKMIPVSTHHKVLDIVGTGGDGMQTINISTGSAILAASCGVKIAKHGNRAVSSLTGAADLLETLGLNIHLSPQKISACIEEIGIGFCFAPNFHPAIKQLRAIRQQLNIPTTLNILGPLLNPAKASHFLLGVFDETLLSTMANVLQQSGAERSMVVHGAGLDELSCAGPATIIEVTPTQMITSTLDPRTLGLSLCHADDLRGGDAQCNAKLLLETLSGKPGAIADTLIFNAAVALYLYGSCASIFSGISQARESLLSGKALRLLKKWREFSHDK